MKVTRGFITIVVLALSLSACGNKDDDTGSGGGGMSTPSRATYLVPDSKCPGNYGHGLLISTETAAELAYVDNIVACTTDEGTETYLKNESDVVFTLSNSMSAEFSPWFDSLRIKSFRSIFGATQFLLPPKGVVTARVAPSALTWSIDLFHSLDWEAQELVANKLTEFGALALLGGAGRVNPAGRALVQCTLAVDAYGKSLDALADKDLTEVLFEGLGAGVATSKCREEAVKVQVSDDAGRTVELAQELERVEGQTAALEAVETHLSTARQGSRLLKIVSLILRHT